MIIIVRVTVFTVVFVIPIITVSVIVIVIAIIVVVIVMVTDGMDIVILSFFIVTHAPCHYCHCLVIIIVQQF